MRPPTMLIILDGFGYRINKQGNAVAHAQMPFFNSLSTQYPFQCLHASGPYVGLLPGYMGNSEVGHLTIGAGRVVPSPLKRVHDAIKDGSFMRNKILLDRFSELGKTGKPLHLVGLLSDAGVHSHEQHFQVVLALAKKAGIAKVYIHAILDGRDVAPTSAATYLDRLESYCADLGCGVIASISGRFYAMDRDANWQRTRVAYDVLCGSGRRQDGQDVPWRVALALSYVNQVTDEFVSPQLLQADGFIKPGDGVFFINFRPDRARQLTEAFINPAFEHFANPINTGNGSLSFFMTMMRYKDSFAQFNNDILFDPILIEHTLLDEVAAQLRAPEPETFLIAETEKYAHVTYFFHGMRERQAAHETRVMIPSLKVKDYTQHPEMSATYITSALIHSLRSQPACLYVVNYANADMVGHSGDFLATVKACEVIDQQFAILYHEVVERLGGCLVITADHGNAEEKVSADGKPLTAHTTNPVPFVVVSSRYQHKVTAVAPMEPVFGLAHVAPTVLHIMGLSIPSVMEQQILVQEE